MGSAPWRVWWIWRVGLLCTSCGWVDLVMCFVALFLVAVGLLIFLADLFSWVCGLLGFGCIVVRLVAAFDMVVD